MLRLDGDPTFDLELAWQVYMLSGYEDFFAFCDRQVTLGFEWTTDNKCRYFQKISLLVEKLLLPGLWWASVDEMNGLATCNKIKLDLHSIKFNALVEIDDNLIKRAYITMAELIQLIQEDVCHLHLQKRGQRPPGCRKNLELSGP